MTTSKKRKTRPKVKPPTTPARRRGRPPKTPTQEQIARVEELAGLGLSIRAIAAAIGIDRGTFAKYQAQYFEEAIERGAALSEERVARKLFAEAEGGNITAAIWIEKTRFGRSDRVQQLHSDADGKPLPVAGIAILIPPNGRDVPRSEQHAEALTAACEAWQARSSGGDVGG